MQGRGAVGCQCSVRAILICILVMLTVIRTTISRSVCAISSISRTLSMILISTVRIKHINMDTFT